MKKGCFLVLVLALCLLPVLAFALPSHVYIDTYKRVSFDYVLVDEDTDVEVVVLDTFINYENEVKEKEWDQIEYTIREYKETDTRNNSLYVPSIPVSNLRTPHTPGFTSSVKQHHGVNLVATRTTVYRSYYVTKTEEKLIDEEWQVVTTYLTSYLTETCSDTVFSEEVFYCNDHKVPSISPQRGRADDGRWGYFCQGFDVCGTVIPDSHSPHTCNNVGATCCKQGECTECGRWGDFAAHRYSLDDYENIDENVTHFFCIWRNEGCTAFFSHTHIPQSDGTPVDFLDEYDIIPNDVQCHLRYCLASEECVNPINGNKCPFKRKSKVGILELHPGWTTLIDKPATCFEDGCIIQTCEPCSMEIETTIPAHGRHDYDYKNPKPVAYNVVSYYCLTPGCVAHVEHSHNFTSDGPKPTNDTRIIPDNYSKHERKYVEHKECDGEHCDETRTVETWKEETHSWRNEIRKEATCLKDGSITHICAGCEMVETIPIMAPGSHVPDYDNPQVISEDEIRYPCKRSGCNEIAKFHRHFFEDTSKKTPTNECTEISGDNKNHKRKYMIQRQCTNGDHCKMLRDFPKWEVESHSWHNEVVKPATCTVDGSKTRMCAGCDYVDTTVLKARGYHQYDYSKPQTVNVNTVKYLCNGAGCQAYETHNHYYINTGASDVWTSSVRKISGGNSSQHERKYLRPQKCNGNHCSLTRNADVWIKESHSWVQKGETHGNCVTPTIKGYQCSKCSMTKTENGAKDPNVHANLATSYVTITNPTCYNDGTGYYPCNACGGRVPTTIKAPGYHTWTVWMITQYPQGNANGTQKRTCRVCGKVESKSFR